jgi:hypothetical protein
MINKPKIEKLIDTMAVRKECKEGPLEIKGLTRDEVKMLRDHGHPVTKRVEAGDIIYIIHYKGKAGLR